MDEIIELMARAIAAAKMGLDNHGERLPDDLWMQADEQAQRALSSLHESGYSVVPNEPTNVMVEVGTEARWRSAVRDANNIREIYRAMIKTALEVK